MTRDRTGATWPLLVAAAVAGGACGPSRSLPATQSQPPPPPIGSQDGGDDGGAVSDDAGPGGDDAAGDASADAADGDAAPLFPPACPPTGMWATIARVASIAPAGFDRFGAISSNALTAAWTAATGGIYVADRASTATPFGAPALLDPGTIKLANDRVALAPTGLELVATLADGSSFVSFFRSSTSAAWAPTNSKEFLTVATMRSEAGGTFAQPVISADGKSLFYLLALPNQAPALYESPWDASIKQWGTGAALPNPEFAIASATQVRRATGAASDRRTLFFFDEVAGHERAAWRDSPGAPFTVFADLPNAPEAAPIDDCTVLYFRGSDLMGPGLFTAMGP